METLYDEHEWTTIIFAPLWVLEVIAGVDQELDEEMWEALEAALQIDRSFRNELSEDVLAELAEDLDDILTDFCEDEEEDPLEALAEVAELLEEKEEDEVAAGFKAEMILLAVQVARARAGRAPGSGIGAEEKLAIGYVAGALDLEEEDFSALLEELNAL